MKPISKVWTFQSDSNPDKTYESLEYADGSTSCNCMGWTRRTIRSCKHTRLIDQGLADSHCSSSHEYKLTTPVKTIKAAPVKVSKQKTSKALPIRRILWQ